MKQPVALRKIPAPTSTRGGDSAREAIPQDSDNAIPDVLELLDDFSWCTVQLRSDYLLRLCLQQRVLLAQIAIDRVRDRRVEGPEHRVVPAAERRPLRPHEELEVLKEVHLTRGALKPFDEISAAIHKNLPKCSNI